MDSVFAKIPDLGDKIISELDNQSLVRCKEVQRSWYNFINEEKNHWLRMIQKRIGDVNKYPTAWKKVLLKAPVDFVAQIAIATQQPHTKNEILSQFSPVHVAISGGNLDLYQQMIVKLADMKQTDIFGRFHPLFLAAHTGQYDICKLMIGNMDDKNPTG